jgi:hypothetical protein
MVHTGPHMSRVCQALKPGRHCRYTPNLLAQQYGRPVHASTYRHASVYKNGAKLGWGLDYLDNEDLEAERLFDYGILVPAVSSAFVCTSCSVCMLLCASVLCALLLLRATGTT